MLDPLESHSSLCWIGVTFWSTGQLYSCRAQCQEERWQKATKLIRGFVCPFSRCTPVCHDRWRRNGLQRHGWFLLPLRIPSSCCLVWRLEVVLHVQVILIFFINILFMTSDSSAIAYRYSEFLEWSGFKMRMSNLSPLNLVHFHNIIGGSVCRNGS